MVVRSTTRSGTTNYFDSALKLYREQSGEGANFADLDTAVQSIILEWAYRLQEIAKLDADEPLYD